MRMLSTPKRSRRGWAVGLIAACMLIVLHTGPVRAQIPDPLSVTDFNLPTQDAQGWSVLAPAADSRLIYVDSVSGDDATGRSYSRSDAEIGADPRQPVGSVRAYRSLAAAYAQLRQDQPDWMLLRAGRSWTGESLSLKRGRSASERQVAISYGQGARPELRTGTNQGIRDAQLSNVAIVGIRFWAHTRDSAGPYFQSYAGSSGISMFTRLPGDARQVRDILIEDCVFRSYSNNVLTGSTGNGALPITRFVMRRSIVSGNYSTEAHSQGLYHVGGGQTVQPSILLEENLFDHNGWRIQSRAGNHAKEDGQATMFNHNIYFTAANGVIFRGNLFMRASSMGNKWTSTSRGVVIEDNLYTEGEIGVGIGGNHAGSYRFKDYVLRDNVVTDIGRTRPTNRSLSWGIELSDWDSGVVTRNLVAHQRANIGNSWGLQMIAEGGGRDVWITNNVVANISAGGAIVRLANGGNQTGVVFRDNTVQSPATQPAIEVQTGGYVFAGSNRYQSAAPANRQFRVNGSDRDLAGWRSATGDAGAQAGGVNFPDAQRSLERYAAELGLGANLDALIAAMHQQSRNNWNPALTAGAINRWMRAGFGMGTDNPAPPPSSITRFVITDAANSRDIAVISEGMQLPRSMLPASINIRADTQTEGSVAFVMTGPISLDRYEDNAPYTAAVEPVGFSSLPGTYRLTATPYSLDGLGGVAGAALVRNFAIVDGPGAMFSCGFEANPVPSP